MISIFSVAVKSDSWKIKETINSYANGLIKIWEKPFTSNHVLRHKEVVERLEKFLPLYYNKVYSLSDWLSFRL